MPDGAKTQVLRSSLSILEPVTFALIGINIVARSNLLQPFKKLGGSNAQAFGNFDKSINTRGLFTAFQFSDVVMMEIGLLGQVLNTQARAFTIFTDCLAQGPAMLQLRHHAGLRKHGRKKVTTVDRL